MWYKQRRVQEAERRRKEAEATALHQETISKIEKASARTKLANEGVNQLLQKRGGITELIFYATGGDRRTK